MQQSLPTLLRTSAVLHITCQSPDLRIAVAGILSLKFGIHSRIRNPSCRCGHSKLREKLPSSLPSMSGKAPHVTETLPECGQMTIEGRNSYRTDCAEGLPR